MRTYPTEPLERYIHARHENFDWNDLAGIGLHSGTWSHARNKGYIWEPIADRVAVALGTLPSDIWPSWYEDGLDMPLCVWCRELLPFEAQYNQRCHGGFCSTERTRMKEYDKHKRQTREKREARVSARVQVMSPDELDAWLGIEAVYEAIAA